MKGKVVHVPALGDDGVKPIHPKATFYHLKPGQSFWPAMFPADELEAIRAQIGSGLFNAIYQGDSTARGGGIFKSAAWFQPLPEGFDVRPNDDSKTLREKLTRCLFVDTAFSELETAHFTAIVTLGMDDRQNIYVIGLHRGKWTPLVAEDHIVMEFRKHKPHWICLEKAAFRQEIVKDMAKSIRGKVLATVREIDSADKKELRAQLPASRAEHQQLFCDKSLAEYRAFEAECLGFPKAKYDDFVDALSGACAELAHRGGFVDLTTLPRQRYSMGTPTPPPPRDGWGTELDRLVANQHR